MGEKQLQAPEINNVDLYDNEKLWEIFPTVSFASQWITASVCV